MTGLQDRIRNMFEKSYREISLSALFALSVLIRVALAPKTAWSGDYLYCIEPWVESYRSMGFLQGLGTEISNYYIPYNIILALISLFPMEAWVLTATVSCVFEYLMIYYLYRILAEIGGEEHLYRAAFAAVLILYLPPVMINGAFWKQCDAIYTAFAVIALYHLLGERYYRAFLFLSISFVFKLQVILLLPVFLIAWFCGKKYNLLLWLRLPVTYLEAGLPAVLCGRPAAEVYTIYFRQSDQYHHMFMNTASLYRLLRSDYEAVSQAGILSTLAILVFLFVWIFPYRNRMTNRRLLQLAAFSGYACFLFLPAMHERYDYLPIILATLYYAYYDRRKLYIPATMVLMTSVMYCEYLFGGNTLPEEFYALISLCAMGLMIRDFVDGIRQEEINVHQNQ